MSFFKFVAFGIVVCYLAVFHTAQSSQRELKPTYTIQSHHDLMTLKQQHQDKKNFLTRMIKVTLYSLCTLEVILLGTTFSFMIHLKGVLEKIYKKPFKIPLVIYFILISMPIILIFRLAFNLHNCSIENFSTLANHNWIESSVYKGLSVLAILSFFCETLRRCKSEAYALMAICLLACFAKIFLSYDNDFPEWELASDFVLLTTFFILIFYVNRTFLNWLDKISFH